MENTTAFQTLTKYSDSRLPNISLVQTRKGRAKEYTLFIGEDRIEEVCFLDESLSYHEVQLFFNGIIAMAVISKKYNIDIVKPGSPGKGKGKKGKGVRGGDTYNTDPFTEDLPF